MWINRFLVYIYTSCVFVLEEIGIIDMKMYVCYQGPPGAMPHYSEMIYISKLLLASYILNFDSLADGDGTFIH